MKLRNDALAAGHRRGGQFWLLLECSTSLRLTHIFEFGDRGFSLAVSLSSCCGIMKQQASIPVMMPCPEKVQHSEPSLVAQLQLQLLISGKVLARGVPHMLDMSHPFHGSYE